MEKFQKKMDIDPQDIPNLDNAHKQDCADFINKVINSTFKYTMIVCVVIAAAYGVYSVFGLIYMLRMGSMLTALSPLLPLMLLITAFFEFVSGTMKRWALVLEIFFHIALVVVLLTQVQTIIAAPFVFYGIILHVKLILLLPFYDVISNQKGYPYFTDLPIGDAVKKAEPRKEKAEASGNDKSGPEKEKKISGNEPSGTGDSKNGANT